MWKWDRILWLHVAGVGAMHLLALAAPFTFSWSGLALVLVGWVLFGGLGVCVGYHRLLTHRSFRAPRWLKRTLAVLGSFTWEGSPAIWVSKHRQHHRASDRPGDPHSPGDGFLWAHMGWVFFHADSDDRKHAQDILRDPFLAWLDRWHAISNVVLAAVLYVVGELAYGLGLSWVVWGVGVRTVIMHHSTWCVNSVCHRYGYRNYPTRDGSTNSWWVAMLTFGEGWHNNHHADPCAASHGHHRDEFDLAYCFIRMLERIGIVKDVRRPRVWLRS
jgi:fatty-acid desaturase